MVVSLKSASIGVTGARLVMAKTSAASSNEASDGVTGTKDENSTAAVVSSKVASTGVLGAKIIEVEVAFEITEAPSLLAKRTFTERVNTAAMMIEEVFIFCFV